MPKDGQRIDFPTESELKEARMSARAGQLFEDLAGDGGRAREQVRFAAVLHGMEAAFPGVSRGALEGCGQVARLPQSRRRGRQSWPFSPGWDFAEGK
jgi:hypothetical protein